MPIREQLILEGVNKTQNAFSQVQRSLSGVERNVGGLNRGFSNLQRTIIGVAAAIGGVKFAGGFLQTARTIENLKFQLAALTGSTQEASKAMEILSEFAGTVPFQLQDIQLAAPSLLAVANGTEELNELLAITGDIAAASGLDFQTVALQLQRTFSAGIGAADLFRDRAVKSMLGFQEGVQYSAQESRDLIITAFREGTINIVGESKKMATTFDGTLSMIGDKFFNFQKQVMDSGPFDALKATVQTVNEALEANFGKMEQAAGRVGDAVVSATVKTLLFAASILDSMKPVFDFIGKSIANLVNFVRSLPPPIDTLGVIGFLMLGGKGKLIVGFIAGVFDTIRGLIGDVIGGLGTMYGAIAKGMNAVGLLSQEQMDAATKAVEDMHNASDRLNTSLADIHKQNEIIGEFGKTHFEGLGVSIDLTKIKADGVTAALIEQIKAIDALIIKNRELEGATADDGFATTAKKDKAQDKTNQQELKKQAEQLRRKFEQLEESLQSEEQRERNSFENRLKILDDYYAGRQHLDKRYAELRQKLETQHQAKIKEIQDRNASEQRRKELQSQGVLQQDIERSEQLREATVAQRNKAVLDSTVEMFQALGQENKKAFMAFKALAVAQAIIDTIASAQSAYRAFAWFPPLAFAAAGAALAAGYARVNAIRSQTYGGRREGGPVTGGSPFLVGEAGPEVFQPSTNGNIIPLDKMRSGKDVNVNFNITTLDASDFQDLLVRERGMIVNIINDAVLEQGREAIV